MILPYDEKEMTDVHFEINNTCIQTYFYRNTIWITRKDIEYIFHLKKARVETLLDKVYRGTTLQKHMHSYRFPVVYQRDKIRGNGLADWVKYLRHYDLETIQQLYRFSPSTQAEEFLTLASIAIAHKYHEAIEH